MLGKFLSHITTAVGNSKRHPQNQFADHGAASGGCIVEKGVLLSFEVNSERCVIPEGVTELREFAINYNRDRIKEVVLPSTIRYIREHNFSSCVNLERINFPEGLVEIGERAFENCGALKEVFLPQSLRNVKRRAFYACKGLRKIHISGQLGEIGEEAFAFCEKLEEVHLPGGVRKSAHFNRAGHWSASKTSGRSANPHSAIAGG